MRAPVTVATVLLKSYFIITKRNLIFIADEIYDGIYFMVFFFDWIMVSLSVGVYIVWNIGFKIYWILIHLKIRYGNSRYLSEGPWFKAYCWRYWRLWFSEFLWFFWCLWCGGYKLPSTNYSHRHELEYSV